MEKLSYLNSVPNNNILDVTKLKVFVDNKLNDAEMTIFHYNGVENTVRKGGNTDYQHFLLCPQCFPKPSSLGSLKVWIVWYTVNPWPHYISLLTDYSYH